VGGKVLSSRTNFEPAGHHFARVAIGEDGANVMAERHKAFTEQIKEAWDNLAALTS
jgi:hypothetical protein